jgi:hypothetical protein
LCAAAVLAFGAAGCDINENNSEDDVEAAREEGEQAGRDRERLRDLENKLREQEKKKDKGGGESATPPSGGGGGGGSPPAPSGNNCGGGLTAGPNTSCAFASNVRDAYAAAGAEGTQELLVYSPTTDKEYGMTCTGGSPHVCTGGNNASVSFP